jgi:phosphohistidine phosphatase
MVGRLVLIRHAKAEQGSADQVRELTRRGSVDAQALGRWLRNAGVLPDRVVMSPATRAVQTWTTLAVELGAAALPVLVEDDRMYDNDVDGLLELIRETPADVGTLMLVGHNPSTAELAELFDDGRGDARAMRELADGYPTSGTAVFAVESGWADVDARSGRLEAFAAPRGVSG